MFEPSHNLSDEICGCPAFSSPPRSSGASAALPLAERHRASSLPLPSWQGAKLLVWARWDQCCPPWPDRLPRVLAGMSREKPEKRGTGAFRPSGVVVIGPQQYIFKCYLSQELGEKEATPRVLAQSQLLLTAPHQAWSQQPPARGHWHGAPHPANMLFNRISSIATRVLHTCRGWGPYFLTYYMPPNKTDVFFLEGRLQKKRLFPDSWPTACSSSLAPSQFKRKLWC